MENLQTTTKQATRYERLTGRDMRTAHANLGITDDDFERANIDTILARQENGATQAEITEIISILDSMRADVIRR